MLDLIALNFEIFGIKVSDFGAAGMVAIAVFLVLAGIRWSVMARTARAAQVNPAGWRAMVRGIARRFSILFIAIMALFAGSFLLDLSGQTSGIVKSVVTIAVVLQAALIADAIVAIYALQHVSRQDAAATSIKNAISLIRFLARTAIWSLAILMVLDNLGLDVTTLVAGLGIGGIAIALAAQNILGDLFSSLAIILDKPFVVGDFVIFGEFSGTIERIGVKTTRLRSLSGEQLVVPNADLLSTRLRNMRRMHERRGVFTLGVVYETPFETLKRIPDMLREIVEAEEMVRFGRAHFASYGDFSLDFEVAYYVKSPEYSKFMDVQQAIYFNIFKSFEDEGIAFAYPTKTVIIGGSKAPASPASSPAEA